MAIGRSTWLTAGTWGLLVIPLLAPPARGQDADSVALAVAVFRAAIVHGQLTAHGGAVPAVICLAQVGSRRPTNQFDEPDSAVIARIRERVPVARPMSACLVEPLRSARDNTPLVVERATGRRGIIVWMQAPARNTTGALTVGIGYYEHGLSAADWICAVRRDGTEWIVNACRMTRIS